MQEFEPDWIVAIGGGSPCDGRYIDAFLPKFEGRLSFNVSIYSASNEWRHKPENTAILRYNYTSPSAGKWTDENVVKGNYSPAKCEYDSDIDI